MTPTEEQIDSAAFIQQRNEKQAAAVAGKEIPVTETKAAAEEKKPEAGEDPKLAHRRLQRQVRAARDEAAELRGQLKVYQEQGVKPEARIAAEATADDPEPQRKDFANDAEHQRALGRWDARQEAKTLIKGKDEEVQTAQQREQYRLHVQAMRDKAAEDAKKIPDYDKIRQEAADDPDAIVVDWNKHENLLGMIAESDVQAHVLAYLAQHQDQLQKLLDLTPNLASQLRLFARLEERAEKMYSTESNKEVVQASGKPKERTTHPAEAQAGRNTAERDALKPRPSTEVSARGGSAPPDEPIPGSKAWMEKRNLQTGGR